jgi:hypothetical protein
MRPIGVITALAMLVLAATAPALACTNDEIAKAVDAVGASLRAVNAENAPRLQGKLRQLKAKRGWSDVEFEERSIEVMHDARVEALDRQANDILSRIDQLGDTTQEKPDCDKLAGIRAASIELVATMRAKSAHTIGRIDALLEDRPAQAAQAKPAADPQTRPAAKAAPPSKSSQQPPAPPTGKDPETSPAWSTTTTSEQTASLQRPPETQPLLPGGPEADDGYTIDEIREATRGFFGQVSTGLASVIEHAFQRGGRPTAYVLGTEGGGAFLAGVRYGDGTLYLRTGGTQRIYWHGPSIGYDVGAAGSRTMFLIYRLRNPDDIYRRFTGIDGSAYLVGGVGITFLTNGDVVMAPIRSGIGLRLGASIGYIRFTPRQTWNPF